jgi:DNA-binding transcriptional MerR regulator
MNEFQVPKLTKLYYSIGEVGDIFQVNTSLLRFWEKEFNFNIAKKNQKGNRLYSVKEIERIRQIYQLVKVEGYTLEGAKQRLNRVSKAIKNPPGSEQAELIAQLESIKDRLIALKTL